ncbi:MAG TPA: tRNA (N(6)-L-threonylcarbamoyladenosine(37)-C(2))-methylthiotransferase MtaB [Candidatus Magasanikbacteria bacterium]|nr:tRNA (N(6)-L-threonylcarbamoyladenosine(37)-C(2))-methylthiotransferase MtaB [Candidatus Magasanikbacteria bacterium]
MQISYLTFGCKLNQAETDSLRRALENFGYQTVDFDSGENVCIIRACAVTCGASSTTREHIRRAKRQGSHVIVAGCLENKELSEIDFVGQTNEMIIEHLLENFYPQSQVSKCRTLSVDKTRAFVKIQTGCNFQCAYCIIPSFRGKSISRKTEEIITELKMLEKQGYKEAVLTGVNICQYQDGPDKLADLLAEILKKTKIPRFRLGSLDPRLIDDKLIKIYKNPRLLPHWHLSLQSGSDNVLNLMRRGYGTATYKKIVDKVRTFYPDFSFTTDIIVGFPGETENDFQETLDFVKKIQFTKVHIFPFSPRPNTPAKDMKPAVQDKIKTERVKILTDQTYKTAQKFAKNFYGQNKKVLFEQKKSGYWFGYSPEYFKIKIKANKNLHNKIITVKLSEKNLIIE